MSYEAHLPQVFPYLVLGDKEMIRKLVTLLVDPSRDDVPFGSSFAVVSGMSSLVRGGSKPELGLYLSNVSYQYITEQAFRDKQGAKLEVDESPDTLNTHRATSEQAP